MGGSRRRAAPSGLQKTKAGCVLDTSSPGFQLPSFWVATNDTSLRSLPPPGPRSQDIWSNNVLAKLSGRSLLVFSVIKDAADEAPEALSWLDPWLEHRGWTRSPDRFHAGHVSKRVRAGNKRALTTLQVLELWEETGVVSGAPLQKVALALEHSYSARSCPLLLFFLLFIPLFYPSTLRDGCGTITCQISRSVASERFLAAAQIRPLLIVGR